MSGSRCAMTRVPASMQCMLRHPLLAVWW
jgi:hypothetical protein